MQDRKRDYLDAYEAWQKQLQALHRVMLDGDRLEPPKLKALLNREALLKDVVTGSAGLLFAGRQLAGLFG